MGVVGSNLFCDKLCVKGIGGKYAGLYGICREDIKICRRTSYAESLWIRK